MNKRLSAKRIAAFALCLVMAFGFAAPSLAATVVGYTTIKANNTPAYSDANCTIAIGTFKTGDIVAVVGQVSASGAWTILQAENSSSICYVKKAATEHTGSSVGGKKASATVASMTATTPTTTTTTTTPTTTTSGGSGQAGYIANCKSYVNFRSSASTSSSSSRINLNTVVTVYELTNGFYRVTNGSSTGYVSKDYIKFGTPPSGSSGGSASSGTGTIVNVKDGVNFRETASSSGKKLGTIKKGATVTVQGTSGSFYKITYDGKTGYVHKDYVQVSSGGGTASAGGSVQFNDIRVEPDKSAPSSTVLSSLNAAKRTNSDAFGWINLKGTNINFPILFRNGNVNFYDDHDASGNTAAKGAVHSFYGVRTRNNTVTAHNQRGSNDMFHQLSHLYDKAAGHSTCQTTDYQCTAASLSSIPDLRNTSASVRQMDIYAFGYTRWEVWAMYKTEAAEPTSTINYNINFLSTASKSEIQSWITYQNGRSIITGSADPSDIFLTLYTCGTNFDSATAQSRIYIFLKAVK